MNQPNKTTFELAEIVLDQTDFEDGGGPYRKGWRSKELEQTQAALTEWIKEKCSKNYSCSHQHKRRSPLIVFHSQASAKTETERA